MSSFVTSHKYEHGGVDAPHSLFYPVPLTMFDDTKTISSLAVPVATAVSLIVLAKYLKSRHSPSKSKFPYPPGPKGLPLIGNTLDLPRGVPIWEGFTQMAEKYRTSMVLTIW